MKGRKPKPTALKLLEGNAGHRPLPEDEPKPLCEIPDCPGQLNQLAQEEWVRIARELKALGLISHLDRTALLFYCEDYALAVEAMGQVSAKGLMVKTGRGNPIQNPYLSIANAAKDRAMKAMEQFGGTPSARTRLHAIAPTGAGAEEQEMFGDA